MRRGYTKDVSEYVQIRTAQLKEDMSKAKDAYDVSWYNRLIQELNWAVSPNHNCYRKEETDARSDWFN